MVEIERDINPETVTVVRKTECMSIRNSTNGSHSFKNVDLLEGPAVVPPPSWEFVLLEQSPRLADYSWCVSAAVSAVWQQQPLQPAQQFASSA